jgi:DNA ligase 1
MSEFVKDSGDHTWPTLYKRTTKGKLNQWIIRAVRDGDPKVGAWIFIERGCVGDKVQVDRKIVNKGKNIGRKNETTPYQQAYKEAQSKWSKKKDREGYSVTKGEAETNVNLMPMLAHDYHKHPEKLKFPCYTQPKKDGVRCLARPDSSLWSRRNIKYNWLDHIREDVSRMITGKEHLDGELFVSSDVMSQQVISGLCRHKDRPTDEELEKLALVEYHVYDYFDLNHMDMPFEERWAVLSKKFRQGTFPSIKLVPTRILDEPEDLQARHDEYVVDQGEEGMILRNMDGKYKLVYRSYDLLKYKMFEDDEFKVVDYYEGEGKEAGLVIWTVEMKNGTRFNVRPRGTHEERETLMKSADSYVGQMLVVRYKDKTDDGIPKLGVGIRLKDEAE